MTVLVPLAGCRHRAVKTVTMAPVPPEIGPVMVSVPPPTHPTEPLPTPDKPVVATAVPVPAPPKKVHRKKPVSVPVAPPVQVAAAAPPPAITLGQLSAGGTAGSPSRTETEQTLAEQKQRLEKLAAAAAAAHPADVEQVRRFLKGADDAWNTGDVEGAHTLALKAKVMLDDLQR